MIKSFQFTRFLTVIMTLGIFVLLVFWILKSRHNLQSYDKWVPTKIMGDYHRTSLMGGVGFFTERQPLLSGNLDMGTWFGFQDFMYRTPIPSPAHVEVDFGLNGHMPYLYVYLNCSATKCLAFRASAVERYPSGLIEINEDESFNMIQRLPLLERGQHQLVIDYLNTEIEISIDGKKSTSRNLEETNLLLFRSGYSGVTIKSIDIKSVQIQDHITFNFTDFNFYSFKFFVTILVILMVLLFVLRLPTSVIKNVNVVLFNLFVIIGLLTAYDIIWFSKLSIGKFAPQFRHSSEILKKTEDLRKSVFSISKQLNFTIDKPLLSANLPFPLKYLGPAKQYISIQAFDSNGEPLEKKPERKQDAIVFFGASQTWGFGATRPSLTWVARLVKLLNQDRKKKLIGVNFAHPNSLMQTTIKRLPDAIDDNTKAVIVSTGIDLSATRLQKEEDLTKIFEIVRSHQLPLLMIYDADSDERKPSISNYDAIVQEFCIRNKIPYFSMRDFANLEVMWDSGFIWRDSFHFADFGHKRAAEELFRRITQNDLIFKFSIKE